MALTVGELVAYLKVDEQDFKRGLREGRRDMAGFQRDADGRLRDMRGRFVAEGRLAGRGFADGVASGAGGLISTLGRIVTSAVRAGAAVGAVTLAVSVLGQASGALGGVIASLVTASGALLLIPGAALAGAAAINTLKLGLTGVGEALQNISDPAKFAEAIEGLSPSARAFAEAVRDLKPAFDDVRLDVQEALFAGLGDKVRALATDYLPVLGAALPVIAAGFNSGASELLAFLGSSGAIADVTAILDATGAAVKNLAATFAPLGQALLDIGAVGASMLPGLTDGAGSAAQAFANFIREARESGELEGWIRAGLDVLGQLGGLLKNVGSILKSVFGTAAAEGGGMFGVLEALTGQVAAFLKSAEGTELLTTVFGAMRVVVDALAPVLGEVAGALAGVLVIALKALVPVVEALAPVLADVADTLGGILLAAVQAVAPFLPLLAQAINAILAVVMPLVSGLAELLVPVLTQVLGAIMPIIPVVIDALMPAISALGEVFLGLVGALLPILPPVAQLIAALLPIAALIIRLAATILSLIVKALTPLIAIIAQVVAWLVGKLAEGITWITEHFGEFFGFVVAGAKAFGKGVGEAIAIVIGFFVRMHEKVVDRVASVVSAVRGVGGKVKDAFANAGRWLYDAGKKIIEGLIDGLKAMLKKLAETAGNIAETIREHFPFSPAKTGPLRDHPMDRAGGNITRDLARGISGNRGLVAAAVADLAGVVAGPAVAATVAPYAATAGRLLDYQAVPLGAGINVEHLEVKAYGDRFSLQQVQDDLAMHGQV